MTSSTATIAALVSTLAVSPFLALPHFLSIFSQLPLTVGTYGYGATAGWSDFYVPLFSPCDSRAAYSPSLFRDPSTGLGSPNFQQMLNYVKQMP